MPTENGLPDDVPKRFTEANQDYTFVVADPLKEAKFDKPIQVGGMKPEHLANVWDAQTTKANAVREQIRQNDPSVVRELPSEMLDAELVWDDGTGEAVILPDGFGISRLRLIGIHGKAGSGKTTVAGMIPGAHVLQLADPLYAMLESCLGVHQKWLRRPDVKAREIPWLGKTPRQLLQSLGTEWGRRMVCDDFWIKILGLRIRKAWAQGISVIAVADVRFENEAAFIRQLGGEIWHILRPGTDDPYAHVSEAGIEIGPNDVLIDNVGTLDDLSQQVPAAFGRPGRA